MIIDAVPRRWICWKVSVRLAKAPEVNASLRLVKDHQLRIAGQNGGDLNTLELAAGETGIHIPVDILLTAQAHLGQIVAGILPADLPSGGTLQQVRHLHSLEAGRLLKAVTDALAGPLGDVQAVDALAVQPDLAGGGRLNAHNDPGQCGLAAAVGAGDDHQLAVRHGKINVI